MALHRQDVVFGTDRYHKERYHRDIEASRAEARARRRPEEAKARHRKWRQDYPERARSSNANWKKNNPGRVRSSNAKRKGLLKASNAWWRSPGRCLPVHISCLSQRENVRYQKTVS